MLALVCRSGFSYIVPDCFENKVASPDERKITKNILKTTLDAEPRVASSIKTH